MTPEATEYTVGGNKVLASWLDYRMAAPKKRYTSPLDHISAPQWDPAWSTELTNLLSILTQLVDLEDQMAELLTDILASPLLYMNQLAADGVAWPNSDADRRPRLVATDTLDLNLDD